MKLDELFPYWSDAHGELLDAISLLSPHELNVRPTPRAASIREIVLDLILGERYWVSHLVAGNAYEKPDARRLTNAGALVEALAAARQVTERVLEPIGSHGLRAVRLAPADAQLNRPETNRPIGWFFWHVLQREIFAWGQIQLRLDDEQRAN